MALLQISEPGQPVEHEHRIAVGIDLGTTHSLVAIVVNGEPQTLTDSENRPLLPSVVHFSENRVVEVGYQAQQKLTSDPLNTIASVKRLLGKNMAELQEQRTPYALSTSESGSPLIRTIAGDKSPVEISAEILKQLGTRAEQNLGDKLEGAVITVPAYFDDAQRQATKDAAQIAGIPLLRLLNEPTAAAVAYGLDQGAEGSIAVYDLGGGTFDISILSLEKGVFQVLSTGGDSALGGDDFDHLLSEWVLQESGYELPLTPQQSRVLLQVSRNAKEQLSEQEEITVELNTGKLQWQGQLNRAQFDEMLQPLIKRTLRATRKAVRDANMSPEQVQDVVLVGGSTRVPAVRAAVEDFFGQSPKQGIDPDRVVALGAAIQADTLIGNRSGDEMLLLDVNPLSLGIEIMGGMVEKIVPRNSTIPINRAQEFTTYKDGQTAMAVHVLQGEREMVKDCRSLARFELRGIPPMTAGAAKIQVSFKVDADGLLSVSARETSSSVESSVEVKPSYGLSENEITGMLQDSFAHAEEDKQARSLREVEVEASGLLDTLNAALKADGDALLSTTEQQQIAAAMDELTLALKSEDTKKVTNAMEYLNHQSSGFAQKRMDHSIREALAGRDLNEVERT
ncbi:MAG: Fe-S protein assembly chaperone HscA [Pseudomonadales bacterium]|nr:Fe-S protein assembly chaperone HscA [Pseudomonadales bacterium]